MTWKHGPTREVDQCAAPVRWHEGRLQQKWIIQTVTDGAGSVGMTVEKREEWRDVPTTQIEETT